MDAAIKTGGVGLLALFLWGAYYFGLPTMAFGYIGIPFIVLLSGGILLLVNRYVGIAGITIGILAMTFLPLMTSWSAWNSNEYYNMIGEVEESVFSQDITPVDISQMRIVDQSVAERIGEKRLGEDIALGSRARLGTFRIQQVNNELYWVAPVVHSGFFKWRKFRTTPGYVMVSASNPREVKYVTEVAGKKINLRYQPQSAFADDLYRHVYSNGYMSQGRTDYTFEIDDNMNPFWVVTIFEKKVGFFGGDATAVAVVDAQTGDIQKYAIADAPAWIDRIQPKSFVETQLNDWGKFTNGWWNQWIFGPKDGVLKATPGTSLVYGADGRSYWYTGISSRGTDNSTVGFMLVDTRTKKAHWYKQPGATEEQAMISATGKVQEKGYDASYPVLYNVAGLPTYVMALKDNAGLIKMISMVSVEDYGIVGVGDNVKDALRSYRSELASKGNAIAPDGAVQNFTQSGEIIRFGMDVRDNKAYYYIVLDNTSGKIFVASSDLSPKIPVTSIGDSVILEFSDGGSGVIDLSGFDNTDISIAVTENQGDVEARFKRAKTEKQTRRDANDADGAWDNLSDEEKAKMLDSFKQK